MLVLRKNCYSMTGCYELRRCDPKVEELAGYGSTAIKERTG